MALIIDGYTYIQHKVGSRPWGLECQFTVARTDGSHINEVIGIPSLGISDVDLAGLVETRCKLIDAQSVVQTETVEITNQDGSVSTFEVPL